MPADDTQSSSWGSSQRPASHLRRSLAAAGRRSTRQTRLRTSEWMHQGGTMAHQQVHRSRWIACRRRSAAPSITISRLSRGKTVEKCTGSRPARNKKSPSRGRPNWCASRPQQWLGALLQEWRAARARLPSGQRDRPGGAGGADDTKWGSATAAAGRGVARRQRLQRAQGYPASAQLRRVPGGSATIEEVNRDDTDDGLAPRLRSH